MSMMRKLNQESFDEYLKMKKEGTLDGYGHAGNSRRR